MQKKILAVVLALAMLFSVMIPMTVASAASESFVDVTGEVINGKMVVTAVTDSSFNRVALFRADDTAVKSCIKTTSSYTVDNDGNRVWTIRISATDLEQTYVLRGRNAESNTYKPDGISEAFTVRGAGIFTGIATETRADMVYATIKTVNEPFDRICVVDAATGEYVKYTTNGTVDGDEIVWTLKFPFDTAISEYLVMARDTRTGYYNKLETATFTVDAPVEPIIKTDVVEMEDGDFLVSVTTIPGLYRVKLADAATPEKCIKYCTVDRARVNEDGTMTWEMAISRPGSNGSYAIDVAYTSAAYARYYTYVDIIVEEIIPDAPMVWGNENKVVDGWYTTADGLVQMYVGDWLYYGQYGLTLIAAYASPVSAAAVAIYPADSDEVFAAKTADDFAAVLGMPVTSFEAVTVDGQYPGYVALTGVYYNLVFQANGYKYFINFIDAADGTDVAKEAERAFNNIKVAAPVPAAPEAAANAVVDGWYTTADGLVQTYVGDWFYYGQYGLTLIAAWASPVSAAAFAIYPADSDEVFAAKTADDFAAVLGMPVTSFAAFTVAGQYPGYIAETGVYYNLVFQANGFKYFINFIDAGDGSDVAFEAYRAFNNIVVLEAPVCEHIAGEAVVENEVPATCTEGGYYELVVYCTECGEELEREPVYTEATGHSFGEWTVVKAADVAIEGVEQRECACGEVETRPIDALPFPDAPDAAANKNAVVDGWYTTADGLVQMYVGNWIYYGQYGLTLIAAYASPVSAAAVAIYEADSDEVFAAKTAEDFATVLQMDVTSFEAVTVAGQYPGYIAETGVYYNLVFQANGYKYFINFIDAADGTDVAAEAYRAFDSIIVIEPIPAAPDAEANKNAIVDGWYTTPNGLVQLYFGNGWSYFGAYGITLATHGGAAPCTVATVATYAADSDEVFAAKTQADFESVLQTTLKEFYPVTVAGEYPGYIALSEDGAYYNLVFQADGSKYFINIIYAGDDIDAAGTLARLLDNVIVIKPAPVRPDEAVWNTIDENGVYTTKDGLVQLQFPNTWGYYGNYGITLTSRPSNPFGASCVAVNIYDADSDEVFAAKTQADFESVLQTDLSTFEAVTIAGKYPGYKAISTDNSYHNLVFQANGYKYFINIISVDGEHEVAAEIFDNLIDTVVVFVAE